MTGTSLTHESLREWARTVELPPTIHWAEIEGRILKEAKPDAQDLAAMPQPLGIVRQFISWFLLSLFGLIIFGAPFLGLAIALLRSPSDDTVLGLAPVLILAVYLIAIIVSVLPLLMWFSTRRRSLEGLALCLGSALASAISVTALAAPSVFDIWSQARALAVVAAVAGAGAFLFLLILGRSTVRPRLRERWRRISVEEHWQRGLRALVLGELRKRDLVSDADSSALLVLPLGGWKNLESLPDGRVVRTGSS